MNKEGVAAAWEGEMEATGTTKEGEQRGKTGATISSRDSIFVF